MSAGYRADLRQQVACITAVHIGTIKCVACVVPFAMSVDSPDADDVLPFDQSDLHEGMGTVERIVALSGYTDQDDVHRGRCNLCGYDRGTYKSHTEVRAWSLTCRQCGQVIGGEE